MKKSEYCILFENLYEKYKDNNSDKFWNYCFKTLREYKNKFINSSQLFPEYRKEIEQEIDISIYNSFISFDDSRNCSLYSWCYRLCSQCIWNFIREKTNTVIIDYIDDIEIPESEVISPEDEIIIKEQENEEDKIKEALKILLGIVEFEIFSMKTGTFGNDKMKIDDICYETCFSKKSIYYINNQNKTKLKFLNNWLRENDLDFNSNNILKYINKL